MLQIFDVQSYVCYNHMCIRIAVKKLPKKLPYYMLVSVILKEDVEYILLSQEKM